MKVIIESGATKSEWRILSEDGTEKRRFLKGGTNVSSMQLSTVCETLENAMKEEHLQEAKGIYLYTAGVVTEPIRDALVRTFRAFAAAAEIDIQNDLMGAARGVCGHESGIVAILGTGSNTCFYDGQTISQKVYSGGYVIGDEGSGAALGKLFLSDWIKDLVPAELRKKLEGEFDSSYSAIVDGVYHSSSPSGYLGSFVPLLLPHIDHPYVKGLIDKNFQDFIDRALARYDTAKYPVGIVGGFAWQLQDILNNLLDKAGIRVARFVKAPIDGLYRYHI